MGTTKPEFKPGGERTKNTEGVYFIYPQTPGEMQTALDIYFLTRKYKAKRPEFVHPKTGRIYAFGKARKGKSFRLEGTDKRQSITARRKAKKLAQTPTLEHFITAFGEKEGPIAFEQERQAIQTIYETNPYLTHDVDHILGLSSGGLHISRNLRSLWRLKNISEGDRHELLQDTDWLRDVLYIDPTLSIPDQLRLGPKYPTQAVGIDNLVDEKLADLRTQKSLGGQLADKAGSILASGIQGVSNLHPAVKTTIALATHEFKGRPAGGGMEEFLRQSGASSYKDYYDGLNNREFLKTMPLNEYDPTSLEEWLKKPSSRYSTPPPEEPVSPSEGPKPDELRDSSSNPIEEP